MTVFELTQEQVATTTALFGAGFTPEEVFTLAQQRGVHVVSVESMILSLKVAGYVVLPCWRLCRVDAPAVQKPAA